MAFPERDRWRAAAARKERVWEDTRASLRFGALPRLSLSSPAISLRKCHMEMTEEEARIRPQTAPGDIHKAIITSTLKITKDVNAVTRV